MQTIVEKGKMISNNTEARIVECLLKELETADNSNKNLIENRIVSMGEKAIPSLVYSLSNSTGKVRAVAAMALIRIGQASVKHLKDLFDSSDRWISEYIIREIEGSKVSLAS